MENGAPGRWRSFPAYIAIPPMWKVGTGVLSPSHSEFWHSFILVYGLIIDLIRDMRYH